MVIQTTVGKTLAIKVNGLHEILLAYGEEVRAHLVHKALIFVLPAHGVLDRVPPLHTQKNQQMDTSDVPKLVGDFKLYLYRHAI